jgi:hypothetical protein
VAELGFESYVFLEGKKLLNDKNTQISTLALMYDPKYGAK